VSKKWQSHFFEKASLRSAPHLLSACGRIKGSTLAPRKVFLSDVHAAGKNDLILFRRSGGETLRGFLTI